MNSALLDSRIWEVTTQYIGFSTAQQQGLDSPTVQTYITNNIGLVTAFVQSLNLLFEHYKRVLIQLFSEYRFNYLNSKNRFNYLNFKTNQPHSQAFPPPVLDCSQYAPLGDHVRKVIIILHFLLWHESFRVTWNYHVDIPVYCC